MSVLARRLATLLPGITLAEAIVTTRIHRVAGRTGDRTALVTTRPFRAPHHTLSDVGRICGGQIPLPGEVSRAHHGVRFLDERPECRRHVLEVLRQPLEEGSLWGPLRGRPASLCVGGFSRTHDGCKRGQVADHSRPSSWRSPQQGSPPRPSRLWSRLVLFA